MYKPGDYVCPSDLPRRVLCRVATAESVTGPSGNFQILELKPLEGSWWRPDTCLVRLDEAVVPARAREIGRLHPALARIPRRRASHPVVRHGHHSQAA